MALEVYRRKRDFAITPEPSGRTAKRSGRTLSFVVQKHAASHLHYDFRLELDGVLLSWAVPKGPSLDPRDRRLAMQTEDHPIEYGDFEGIIPPRQYGAGTVIVWDRGTWEPLEDAREGRRKGRLKFRLNGEKLQGVWLLVKSRGGKYNADNAWLLIKDNDDAARQGTEADIVGRRPESVLTERTLEDVARDGSRVWHSTKSVAENVRDGATAPLPAGKIVDKSTKSSRKAVSRAAKMPAGARKAALPALVHAQLATLVDEAPAGEGWVHEIKYDGYRMLCRVERGRCQVWSRNGKDWTANFPAIAREVARLPVKSAWIDGEIVMLGENGGTSFQALQNAMSANDQHALVYFAFDLVHLDGYDLREVPLVERKRLLESLVGSQGTVRYSPHLATDGPTMLREACKLGLEGIISKRADAPYQATRGRAWLKVKCSKRQEFVIGGFTEGQGSRSGFGALHLGVYEDGKLRYVGKVGTGFNEASLAGIRKRLDRLRTDAPPFANPPKGAEARRATWVKPVLVGEVEFTEWTRDGTLRHPSFQGLREDKPAKDVVRETEAHVDDQAAPEPAKRTRRSPNTRSAGDGTTIAGVAITHPDRILWRDAGVTKGDLCAYYEAIAPLMLPHLVDRPLSLVRCPDGADGKCFYQKHAKDNVPDWVPRVEVQDSDGPAEYMMANDVRALVTLAQFGVIEFHPWGSRRRKLTHPDRLVFDLDPDDALPWAQVKEAALLMRGLLEDLGLRSFLKTTGGKGLHVVVPIAATMDWDTARDFVRDAAGLLARTFPERFTDSMSKRARPGRIFIDYLRNAHGATAIAPYAARARKGAAVSTPVDWSVLDGDEDVRFDAFSVRSLDALLARPDPWKDLASVRQTVTVAMRRRLAR
jgi:bifunctional non-homologous end joining protein LigD